MPKSFPELKTREERLSGLSNVVFFLVFSSGEKENFFAS
jgi:hypothetical protein